MDDRTATAQIAVTTLSTTWCSVGLDQPSFNDWSRQLVGLDQYSVIMMFSHDEIAWNVIIVTIGQFLGMINPNQQRPRSFTFGEILALSGDTESSLPQGLPSSPLVKVQLVRTPPSS